MTTVTASDVKLGSFLLDTLTVGMYENPFHCIREYVQNGFDAINDAAGEGKLVDGGGRISIQISGTATHTNLKVIDNGTGVAESAILDRLVSIGNSSKNPRRHAGFRGIGRLAGIAYCTELRFTTTAEGEDFASIVSFDCPRARDLMVSGTQPQPLPEIISKCVTVSRKPARVGEHYTEVEMLKLTGLGTEFSDPKALEDYLSQYCPTDFSSAFKLREDVELSARRVNGSLPVVQIELKARREVRDIRKPYTGAITAGGKTSPLLRLEVIGSAEHGWFGWFGITDFHGEISESKVAGLRFRQRNIQVGDASVIEQIAAGMEASTNRRLMKWVIGEVHITNPKVVPNARRDGFEDTVAWRTIRKDMEQVIGTINKLVRRSSTKRNELKRFDNAVAEAKEKISGTGGAIPRTVRDEVDAELDKQLKAISKKLDKGFDPDRAAHLISEIKEIREQLKAMPVAPEKVGLISTRIFDTIEKVLHAELKAAQAKKIFAAIKSALQALQASTS